LALLEAKNLLQEESQKRKDESFSKLLGLSPSSNEAEEEIENAPHERSQKGLDWGTMDPAQKALFAYKFPQVAKQLQSDFEHREKTTEKEQEEPKKYLKEIREKYGRAQSFKPVFSELRDTIEKGGADAFTAGNLSEIGTKIGGFSGTTINAIGKSLESGDTARFRALSKRLLDEMKDIFGGQIRVKELEVFLSMLPEIGKSKEANLSSVDALERISEASTMFYETAQDIIQKNDGKIPKNLADQVQEKLSPVLKDLASDIKNTTKEFTKSSQGKVLSKNEAMKILQEAQGDKQLARKIAQERGYKL